MKAFTKDQLVRFNGTEGRPAYVAHKGIVYDVSESKRWRNGQHMRRHQAGEDLSAEIQAAPHSSDLLKRFPQIGTLEQSSEIPQEAAPEATRSGPTWLTGLMTANPFLRRHPHPMTVHFPLAFILAHPLFIFLSWVTGYRAFATTAHHCLACGILGLAAAMATGLFTWWYNYLARMMPAIAIKITLSIVTLVVSLFLFFLQLSLPNILTIHGRLNILFLILSFCLAPMISIIGWYGATLTFPINKK